MNNNLKDRFENDTLYLLISQKLGNLDKREIKKLKNLNKVSFVKKNHEKVSSQLEINVVDIHDNDLFFFVEAHLNQETESINPCHPNLNDLFNISQTSQTIQKFEEEISSYVIECLLVDNQYNYKKIKKIVFSANRIIYEKKDLLCKRCIFRVSW